MVEGLRDDVTVTVGAVFTTVTETAGEVAGLLLAVAWSAGGDLIRPERQCCHCDGSDSADDRCSAYWC